MITGIIKVDGKDYELLEQKIDTVFIEKIVEVKKYVPKYVDRVVEKVVEIPVDVDSLKIIEDYYSKYIVKDTLNLTYDFGPEITVDSLGTKPNPSLGFGILTDTISQNQIISRDIKWNFQIPTIYNTKIVKDLIDNHVIDKNVFGFLDFFKIKKFANESFKRLE